MPKWPICPWHSIPADQCPAPADETYPFSEEGGEDHMTWLCHVMADQGDLERVISHHEGGVVYFKSKGKPRG